MASAAHAHSLSGTYPKSCINSEAQLVPLTDNKLRSSTLSTAIAMARGVEPDCGRAQAWPRWRLPARQVTGSGGTRPPGRRAGFEDLWLQGLPPRRKTFGLGAPECQAGGPVHCIVQSSGGLFAGSAARLATRATALWWSERVRAARASSLGCGQWCAPGGRGFPERRVVRFRFVLSAPLWSCMALDLNRLMRLLVFSPVRKKILTRTTKYYYNVVVVVVEVMVVSSKK